MNLIIISGAEATGKTFIGQEIAKALGYKHITKDIVKEAMFDKETHSTWNFSWYESRAKDIFFSKINILVNDNDDAVIESNFIGKDKKKLQACLRPDTTVREVYCYSRGMTTLKRFVARNESGNRHKGHHDRRWYLKVLLEDLFQCIDIQWPSKPSGLDDSVLKIDTTDLTKIDIQSIIKSLRVK